MSILDEEPRARRSVTASGKSSSNSGKKPIAVFKKIKGSVRDGAHGVKLLKYMEEGTYEKISDSFGKEIDKALASKQFKLATTGKKGVLAHHLIFSGKCGGVPLRYAVSQALEELAPNNDYVLAIHEGRNSHYHAHVMLYAHSMVEGEPKVRMTKAFCNEARAIFANALTATGIPHVGSARYLRVSEVDVKKSRNLPIYLAKVRGNSRDELDFQRRMAILNSDLVPKKEKKLVAGKLEVDLAKIESDNGLPAFDGKQKRKKDNIPAINAGSKEFLNYAKMREVAVDDADFRKRCALMKRLPKMPIGDWEKKDFRLQLMTWRMPLYDKFMQQVPVKSVNFNLNRGDRAV